MKILVPLLFVFIGITSFISMNDNSSKIETKVVLKDSLMLDREKYITFLKDSLKGKETVLADSVFKYHEQLGSCFGCNL